MQGEIMERGKAARRQAILLLAASSNAGGDRKPAPRRWRNNAGLRPIRRPGSSSLQWDQPRSRGGGEGEDPGPSGFKIRSLFGLSCSASSASLVQVHAMSVRMERTLRFGARSAICRHSTARCLHSTGVIIDTQPDTRTDQGCSSPLYDNCNRSPHMQRGRNRKIYEL
jgi:hypothetical protein